MEFYVYMSIGDLIYKYYYYILYLHRFFSIKYFYNIYDNWYFINISKIDKKHSKICLSPLFAFFLNIRLS